DSSEIINNHRLKRKRQKAVRRANADYHQREREQQRKRREIRHTKRQKIRIEKDIQAIEANGFVKENTGNENENPFNLR
ncbi:2173_t:CDS:2, partial [Racocetra persica]